VRRVAYYKGCLASLSAKELDTSTKALAPKVGLELVELESVTCCGAGDIHEAAPQHVTVSSGTSSSPTFGASAVVEESSSFAESDARQPR